jgi:acyl carrier protein
MAYEEKIKWMIVDLLNCKKSEVVPMTRIIEDLGADSLDIVELTMYLEEEFNIDIRDEEITSIETVQDVIDFVNKKLGVTPNQEVDPIDQLIDLFNNPDIFLTREDLKTTPPSTIKQFLDILNSIKERTTKNEKEDR